MNGFNPCRLCGHDPELRETGYGKNHLDVLCGNPGCVQRIEVDDSVGRCRKAWNTANPLPDERHQQ